MILDIDNTLEPYENPKPGEKVKSWITELNANGIKTSIVSNNDEERVRIFNEDFGMPAYAKSGKPFKNNILRALNDMAVKKEEAAFIGDQIFTDVFGAHNAGIIAFLVPPIRDRKDLLTKFKRWLEKPIMKMYMKREKKDVR